MRRFSTVLVAAVLVTLLGPGATPSGAIGAPVPDTLIDFEGDTSGQYPNGYTSSDSPFVHFSEVGGSSVMVYRHQVGIGEGELSLYPTQGTSLRMVLDRTTNRISFRFGYDLPSQLAPGDEAVLTVFRGTRQVGQTRVVANRNSVADQTIGFSNGPLFNRVTFRYDTTGISYELVDRIVIGPLCTIAGTETGETLVGTIDNDVICGGGGNDTIFGRAGRDHISGGNGQDTISGEDGDDFLAGNLGVDTIRGGNQDDLIEGGEQGDRLFGDAGNDRLSGGPAADQCNGGSGNGDTRIGCESAVGFP